MKKTRRTTKLRLSRETLSTLDATTGADGRWCPTLASNCCDTMLQCGPDTEACPVETVDGCAVTLITCRPCAPSLEESCHC